MMAADLFRFIIPSTKGRQPVPVFFNESLHSQTGSSINYPAGARSDGVDYVFSVFFVVFFFVVVFFCVCVMSFFLLFFLFVCFFVLYSLLAFFIAILFLYISLPLSFTKFNLTQCQKHRAPGEKLINGLSLLTMTPHELRLFWHKTRILRYPWYHASSPGWETYPVIWFRCGVQVFLLLGWLPYQSLKGPVCPNISWRENCWIHTFPKMGKVNSLVRVLNSGNSVANTVTRLQIPKMLTVTPRAPPPPRVCTWLLI